jgi:ankyrin repeat protein
MYNRLDELKEIVINDPRAVQEKEVRQSRWPCAGMGDILSTHRAPASDRYSARRGSRRSSKVALTVVLVRACHQADGWTIAHWAAQRGYDEMMSFIADRAPPLLTTQCNAGSVPAHFAASYGHNNIIALLAERDPASLMVQVSRFFPSFAVQIKINSTCWHDLRNDEVLNDSMCI